MPLFDYDEEIRHDAKIHKGRTFELHIRDPRSGINYAGYNFAGQIYSIDTGAVVATFEVVKDDVLQKAIFRLPPTETATLTAGENYIYDIQETTDTAGENQYAWGLIPIYDTVTP